MLCLSRRSGQAIVVGEGDDAVEIKVYAVGTDRVRLAISGPRSVRIDRKEVREQRHEQNDGT